jgi:SAM-dependent methyltransferase
MEKQAFRLLHAMEDSWWYRGRSAVVRSVLAREVPSSSKVLDFGAGFGGMYNELAVRGDVFGFEPDPVAQKIARGKDYRMMYDSEHAALRNSYDLIGLFDVLEHIEDDNAFLTRAKKALRENGKLAITVPANPYLWSVHDVSHHRFRRYTKKSLQKVLQNNGYTIEYISYWNAVLFLPALLTRLLGSSGEGAFALPKTVDGVLYSIVRLEAALMKAIPMPFGVSLVALARI